MAAERVPDGTFGRDQGPGGTQLWPPRRRRGAGAKHPSAMVRSALDRTQHVRHRWIGVTDPPTESMLVWPMLAAIPAMALLLPAAMTSVVVAGIVLLCAHSLVMGALYGPSDIALFTVRQRRRGSSRPRGCR